MTKTYKSLMVHVFLKKIALLTKCYTNSLKHKPTDYEQSALEKQVGQFNSETV